MQFFETSAQDEVIVAQVFEAVARLIVEQRKHENPSLAASSRPVPILSKPSFWSRLWDRNTEDARTKPPESQLAVPPQRGPRDVRDERRTS
jgi:hypothetical protein